MSSGAGSGAQGARELRPAGQTRLQELLGQYPLVSFAITCLCLVVYVGMNLGDFNAGVSAFAMQPALVILDLQLFRVVTCAYVHLSMLHIGMNMLTLFGMGTSLEAIFGSLHFFFLVLAYTMLVGIVFLALSLLQLVVWSPAGFLGSAAGFSGVLFAMAVDESSLSTQPTRSVFGLFSVPTKLYPWALMLAISLAVPGVSFTGHLAGIIVGCAHTAGWLSWMLPGLPTLRYLEDREWMRPIVRLQLYRLVPQSDPVLERNQSQGLLPFIAYALAPVTQCLGSAWASLRGASGRGAVGASAGAAAGSAGAGVAASAGAGRFSGRGNVAASPAASSIGATAPPGGDVEAGPVAQAPGGGGGGIWGSLATALGARGSSHEYATIQTAEDDDAQPHGGPSSPAPAQATASPSTPAATAAIAATAAAAAVAARAEARAKAAAAAEARAAASRIIGVPQQDKQATI
jgi:rhomboid domain-containing protein 1